MTIEHNIVDPVERCLSVLSDKKPRTLVGLAGFPGSGKSTLARQIVDDVNQSRGKIEMVALGMDGFHLTRLELSRSANPSEAFKRRGAPWTFDSQGFLRQLITLRRGVDLAVTWPAFEHGTGDPVQEAFSIETTIRLVLVEGLYVLYNGPGWEEVPEQFDEKWFLNTSMDESLSRLASRHMLTRGITRDAAEMRIAENDKLNADIVSGTKEMADYLVSSRTIIN